LSKIESLKLVRKPTYHVSRNVPFFVFRKFWFALCLLYGKTLSKNLVEYRKFIIDWKANESRFSECDFLFFRKFWLVLGLRCLKVCRKWIEQLYRNIGTNIIYAPQHPFCIIAKFSGLITNNFHKFVFN